MIQTLMLGGILLLAQATARTPQVKAPTPVRTGSLSGQLRSSDGGATSAVRVVAMLADDGSGKIVGVTQSGSDGRYELNQIPPGRYYILAGQAEYPTYYPGVTEPKSATAVRVNAGARLRADFPIRRVGITIAGRVVYERPPAQPPFVRLSNTRTGTPRDSSLDEGTFEFRNVVPGTYRLEGSAELDLAAVTITANSEDVRNIRLAPKSLKLYSLSGRILISPTGSVVDLTKLRVVAGTSSAESARLPRTANVRADGTFEILDVSTGPYRLSAKSDTAVSINEKEISIVDRDLTGVEVTVTPQIPARIRVTMDKNGPLPEGLIRFRTRLGNTFLTGSIPRDGISRTFLAPGRNHVFLQPPPGYFVKSLTAGSVNLLTQPLDIDPKTPELEIDAVMSQTPPPKSPTVTVSGRVTGGHPRMKVRLADPIGATVMEERTNAAGAFVFRNVSPGVYRLDVPPALEVISNIIAVGEDVADLDLTVPEGVVVTGRMATVVDRSGRYIPIQPTGISIRLTNGVLTKVYPLTSAPFIEGLPPGKYAVSIEGVPEVFTIRSVTSGQADLLHGPLRLDEDSSPDEIQVILQSNEAIPR